MPNFPKARLGARPRQRRTTQKTTHKNRITHSRTGTLECATARHRPERRQQRQLADVRLSYRVGLLTLSLQDQLVHDRVDGLGRLSNLVYVLVSRSFGGEL